MSWSPYLYLTLITRLKPKLLIKLSVIRYCSSSIKVLICSASRVSVNMAHYPLPPLYTIDIYPPKWRPLHGSEINDVLLHRKGSIV